MLGLRKRWLTSVVALATTIAGCDTFADRPPPDNGFPGGTNVGRPLPPTSAPIPVAGVGSAPIFFDAGLQAGAAGLRAAGSGGAGAGAGAGQRAPATANDAGPDDAGK